MTMPRKRPDALNINMGLDRLRRVDAYWHRRQLRNRTAAIHELLDDALDRAEADPPPPSPDAAPSG